MFKKLIALLLTLATVYYSFYNLLPNVVSNIDAPEDSFSTARALIHLKEISKEQHYLGSKAHNTVRNYIVNELEKLGMETHIQEGYSMSKWGNLSKPKNILARIKGSDTSKALLLLSHYDSSPHSSFGASDAGSGVVTILEGLRAFLNKNKTPKNDIIILISDAEELGLNGADIFVNKHPWAKDVGLVLNFEARGSGGPSYMLLETNQGNANLIKEFKLANPKYPVANSLAYSIYKLLPNDTDLTVFRRDGDIQGFNFAFIDDHFDYHTALDTYSRLDRKTLEHHGSYLMPLLYHFSKANLNNIKSKNDYIYFNVPLFKTISYPFSWILPMLFIAILVFITLIIYGVKQKTLQPKEIGKGFLAFFLTLIGCVLLGFYSWRLVQIIYPQYNEMLHGFTYNGHFYIVAFAMLALAICFYIFHKVYKTTNTASLLIAPLFFWIILCTLIAFKLKGASFFIVPVLFGLLSLYVLIRQQQPRVILYTLLGLPALAIMAPFIKMFPVGLGLKMLVASTVFVALLFGLLISVYGFFKHKNRWSFLFLIIAIGFLIMAHFNSGFNENQPKPNSLVYMLNADENTANWATYDTTLDAFTKDKLTKNPDIVNSAKNTIGSKYKTGFSFTKKAKFKDVSIPKIEITHDTLIGNLRRLAICVTPQRKVNRIEVFVNPEAIFKDFKVNSVEAKKDSNGNSFSNRYKNRLFTYYISEDEPLDLIFTIPKAQEKTILTLYEASYDLLTNSLFSVKPRTRSMIPKPFVLNDAIIVEKKVTIN